MDLKWAGALLVAILAITVPDECFASEDKEMMGKVSEGLGVGSSIADALGTGYDEESKAFKRIGKMSAYLGAVGGMISLVSAFLPEEESAELQFMRKKFEEVNEKLDNALQKLDKLPDLIKYHSEKAKFYRYESKIQHGYKQLQKFVTEMQQTKCSSKRDCKKKKARVIGRYKDSFDLREALSTIVNGAIKKGVFGDAMIDVIKSTFKCDVPKIEQFSTGILRLAYKAQQAILAYEKVTGSKQSITNSIEHWIELMYQLRNKNSASVMQCYNNIENVILKDIRDGRYQEGENSDAKSSEVAGKLKAKLHRKYKWLDWVTLVYKASGDESHCVRNVLSNHYSSGKRNVVALPVDKRGNFRGIKSRIHSAINSAIYGRESPKHACRLYSRVMETLSSRDLTKYISSFAVLLHDRYHKVAGVDEASYVNDLRKHLHNGYKSTWTGFSVTKTAKYFNARFVYTFKSHEQMKLHICNDKKRCSGNGKCHVRPFSSQTFCICNKRYHGDKCESRSNEVLAATVDSLLDVTMQLPTMTDIQYDIKDLREYVGIGFSNIHKALNRLEATVVKAADSIKQEMAAGFRMSSLVTQYSETIYNIDYYEEQLRHVSKFATKAKDQERMSKDISRKVLGVDKIELWLDKIDSLIRGREAAIGSHKALLVLFIETYGKKSCTLEYKKAVDNCWRRMFLLQERGFILWARARELMDLSSKEIIKKYNVRTKEQVHLLTNQKTCSYFVPGSETIRCTKGMLLARGASIDNKCMKGYYDTGLQNASCERRVASCSRDCVWGSWSKFTTHAHCPCGNHQLSHRTRSIKIERVAQGKLCKGPTLISKPCFSKCCPGQFDCTNKRCVPKSARCNYVNNCGNKRDELSCMEEYYNKVERWRIVRQNRSKRHYVKIQCDFRGGVLNRFALYSKESDEPASMRYGCSRLFGEQHICRHYRYYSYGEIEARCGNGFLTEFQMSYEGSQPTTQFRCCGVSKRLHCTTNSVRGSIGKGFLMRANVYCPRHRRYFLKSFRKLDKKPIFEYQCCRITF